MNWGNKLILVFLVFGAMISFMVYRCMKTPVDLVAKEYYRDELAYQQVIDGIKRADALNSSASLQQEAGGIVLQLPAEMQHHAITGSILFYCPSDVKKDRSLPLTVDTDGRQFISGHTLQPGHYRVKIEWDSKDLHYFTEKPLVIL